jgi:cation diffusion facilitator CzcD-associated flavoprotein CzcO
MKKFEEYIVEDRLDEMAVKTKKDLTAHVHTATVDANGDGKTVTTSQGEEHEHIIYQWMVQPSHGHIHNLEE